MTNNSNPLGNPMMSEVRVPAIKPPRPDVVRKQDSTHTTKAFLRDLKKVTKKQRSAS